MYDLCMKMNVSKCDSNALENFSDIYMISTHIVAELLIVC